MRTLVQPGLFLLVAVLIGTSARSQDQPPDEARLPIEEAAVAVRLYDRALESVEQFGAGLVVADTGDQVTIVTADHVVAPARHDGQLEVQLRFFGRDVWVNARLLDPVAPAEDVAALVVPRKHTPFGRRSPVDKLNVPPPVEGQDRMWLLGLDRLTLDMNWLPVWLTQPPDASGQLVLEGHGVEPGYSGGVIVSELGPIGMMQQRGPAGRDHRGMSYAAIARLFEQTGAAFALRPAGGGESLAHALDRQLAVSLYVIDLRGRSPAGFWSAIKLERVVGGGFAGTAYTGGSRYNVAPVKLQVAGSGLTIELERDLGWPLTARDFPVLPARRASMSVSPTVRIAGMLVFEDLQATHRAYLAVPTAASELIPARWLLDHLDPAGGGAVGKGRDDLDLSSNLMLAGGELVPFATLVKPGADQLSVKIDDWRSRNQTVRLAGKTLLPDLSADGLDADDRRSLTQVQMEVLGRAGDLLHRVQATPGAGRFEAVVQAGQEMLMLHFIGPRSVMHPRKGILVSDLTITYEAMR